MAQKIINKATGLIIFGIILLAIGFFAFYSTLKSYDEYHEKWGYYPVQCPLCNAGTVLIAAGIIFLALGLLYPSWGWAKQLLNDEKDDQYGGD